MSEPKNPDIEDSTLSVTLTVGQLRALVREEVQAASNGNHGAAQLLTSEELADRLRVPLSWVYEQSRMGNIPTYRFGRYIRFNLVEVLASQKKD